MVFTVGEQPNSNKTDFIDVEVEGGYNKAPPEVILPTYYPRHEKRNRCCIIIPWFLFTICFLLLGFSMCWGWSQHRRLQSLLNEKNSEDNPLSSDQQPLIFGDKLIPYGNDALFANYGPSTDEDVDDNDDEVREDVFQTNNQEQPLSSVDGDTKSFTIFTISLPRFQDLDGMFSSWFDNFKFEDLNAQLPMNDTGVSSG